MSMRTESEIRAYIDGYNACFEQFCECLKSRSAIGAVREMELYHAAVNNVIIKEKNHEQSGRNRNQHLLV